MTIWALITGLSWPAADLILAIYAAYSYGRDRTRTWALVCMIALAIFSYLKAVEIGFSIGEIGR